MTEPSFVMTVPSVASSLTVTEKVTVALPPAGTLMPVTLTGSWLATVPLEAAALPTAVAFAGMASSKTTPAAARSPLLVIVIV